MRLDDFIAREITNACRVSTEAHLTDWFNRAGCPARGGNANYRTELNRFKRSHGCMTGTNTRGTIDVTSLRGYAIWQNMEKIYKQINLRNVSYQMQFREKIMCSLLPMIYGENNEWALYQNAIMAHHGVDRVYPFVALVCARQMGKSTVIAQVMVAFTLSVASRRVFVISIAQQQADNMREYYMRCLARVPGYASNIVRYAGNIVMVSRSGGKVNGDFNTLTFAASTATTSRGNQLDVAVIDEAGFVKDKTFRELLVPLIQLSGTLCLMISSPPAQDNFFTRALTEEDSSGERIADSLHINQLCQACQDACKATCPHKENIQPPWKNDPKRAEQMAILYGDANTMLRESAGVLKTDGEPAFEPGYVTAFKESIPVILTQPPVALLISIDPSGGGFHSDCGITILAVDISDGLKLLVVGGASVPMSKGLDATVVNAIRVLMTKVRRMPYLDSVPLAVAIEGNLCMLSATNLANNIAAMDPRRTVLMSETRSDHGKERVNGPYVLLDPINGKERYVRHASTYLHNFRVRWMSGLATLDGNVDAFQRLLVDQLGNFKMTIRDDSHGLRPSKRFYTGKLGGRKDDLCMSFLQAVYQIAVYVSSPTYAYHRPLRVCIEIYQLSGHVDSEVVQQATEIMRKAISYNPYDDVNGVERIPYDPRNPDARCE